MVGLGFSFNNQSSTTQGVGKLHCEETLFFEGATEIIYHNLMFSKGCIPLNTVGSRPERSSAQMQRDHNQIK